MKSSCRMVKEKTKNLSLSSRIQELFYFKKMQTTLTNQRLATILGTIFKIVNQNRKDLNTYNMKRLSFTLN